MKKEIADLWVKALRSGEYKQTQFRLEDADGNCCLGVLCRLAQKHGIPVIDREEQNGIVTFNDKETLLPSIVRIWAEMAYDDGTIVNKKALVVYNDGNFDTPSHSFDEIATIIEQNWEKL